MNTFGLKEIQYPRVDDVNQVSAYFPLNTVLIPFQFLVQGFISAMSSIVNEI